MSNRPEIANEIWSAISAARRILLHCHPGPDPDSVGGALATYHALSALGKEVRVIQGDSDLPQAFKHFPGAGVIEPKTFLDIDQSEFDLFLILDTGSKGQVSKRGEFAFAPTLKTIIIDHHQSNDGFADIDYIDPDAPATCQILFELFVAWQIKITPEIALCLFAGLWADTGGFRFSSTNRRSFEIAADLVTIAPNFYKLLTKLINSNTKERIIFEALALNATETFFAGRVAISAVALDLLEANKIKREDTDGSAISEKLRSVSDWQIVASFVEKEPGRVAMSLRSDGETYDVSKVAKRLGGGGHKAAAGGLLFSSVNEAREAFLAAIATEYPELGSA